MVCKQITAWKTFNGTSDFVSIPSSSSLQLPKFSVAVWFRTDKDYTIAVEDGMIVNKGGTGQSEPGRNQNYNIRVFKSTNKIRAGFETSGATDHEPSSINKVNDGQWRHCVVTYDGQKVRLYHEGGLIATDTTSSTPDYKNTQPLVIGKNSYDNTRYFKGDISQVLIWNRAISGTEVNNLYETGAINTSGLVYRSN